MKTFSKKVKRGLKEYAIKAYELELHRELGKLEKSFAEWKAGKISSGELGYRIHRYYRGPSYKLFKKYNYGDHNINVAYAIVTGLLDREEMPEEIVTAIEDEIGFYETLKENGDLREPGGG